MLSSDDPWTLKLARLAGLVLLTVGMAALLLVLLELWLLYQDPSGILTLTRAVDAVGGLDGSLLGQVDTENASDGGQRTLPIAYFLAWTLAIVLLATIGRVAYWAIRAGGDLLKTPTAQQSPPPQAETSETQELPEDYRPSHRRTKGQTAKHDLPHLYPRK